MKTYELVKVLEQLALLLKSLPDGEIGQVFKVLQQLVDDKPALKKESTKGRAVYTALPEGVVERIHRMTPSGAENFLATDATFVSTASFLRLSSALGIETSKRQSRSAVVNSIIRHLEARKMGSIIRQDTSIESKVSTKSE